MTGNKELNRRLLNWLLIVAAWMLVALFVAAHQSLLAFVLPNPPPFWRLLGIQVLSMFAWVALTPVILFTARSFPPEGRKFHRNLIIQIVCGLIFVLVPISWDSLVTPFVGFPPNRIFYSFFEAFTFFFLQEFLLCFSIYCAVLGIIFGINYYRKFREREFRSLQLEAKLAQTRLHVLKMQLHPHFLFNTHNAISELIYKDQRSAEQMLTNLSDLLRLSLDNLEVEEVSLKQELEFLNKYLEIEQTRFQDRLQVNLNIAPETLRAVVPNMILQPLVENAIKHGIAPLARGGTIKVDSIKENQKLHLQISDDGIGIPFKNPEEIIEGIGLSNTRARLQHLYGRDHSFDIQPNGDNGLRLNLIIPFTTEAGLKI